MWWIWSALGIILLAYAGLCLFYYVFQERFIFIRLRTRRSYRYLFAAPHRELWLERPDGARLHALYFPAENERGTLLYFHGNTGNLKRWGRRAERFTRLGYNVLMPDPRGYGKSNGRTSEAALMADAVAWYDQATATTTATRMVVYGCSLGCALAIPVAAQREPALLLLEAPFANLTDVARSYLPILPYGLLLRYPFQNDRTIPGVRCPTYLFHGRRDQVVPYTSGLKLYAAIPANVPRELFTFPRGAHHDLYRFARFRHAMERLLKG